MLLQLIFWIRYCCCCCCCCCFCVVDFAAVVDNVVKIELVCFCRWYCNVSTAAAVVVALLFHHCCWCWVVVVIQVAVLSTLKKFYMDLISNQIVKIFFPLLVVALLYVKLEFTCKFQSTFPDLRSHNRCSNHIFAAFVVCRGKKIAGEERASKIYWFCSTGLRLVLFWNEMVVILIRWM